MTDSTKIRQPEDPQKINVNQKWELAYWTSIFNVTEAQLKAAVAAVGPMVKDVKKKLGK